MEMIELIGSTMGLGFVAGIRLYATILALGVAIRFGWLHLGAIGEPLRILAHPAVLAAAGVAYLAEFFADKIPWVDSTWDSFHTFIRPIGAALLAAAVLGHVDPVLKLTMIILCGGVAFASHSSKAATRLVVNHIPEPFTNIAISLAEDAFVPIGVWLSLSHPILVLSFVLAFLACFIWVMPRVFRSVRLQLVALRVWIWRGSATVRGATSDPLPSALKPGSRNALRVVWIHASPIPEAYARSVNHLPGYRTPAVGIRVAATKSIRGYRNSIGYLVIGGDDMVFVARRRFRHQIHRIMLGEIESAEWKRGLFMNSLILHASSGDSAFYVFKDVRFSHLPVTQDEACSAREGW